MCKFVSRMSVHDKEGVGNHHCRSTRVSVIVCGCVQKKTDAKENNEYQYLSEILQFFCVHHFK